METDRAGLSLTRTNQGFPFVVLEGIDGSGKTTVAQELAKRWEGVVLNTPPECLRDAREYIDTSALLEVKFLYYLLGARVVSDQIKVIRLNSPVIVDRYYYSTLVSHLVDGLSAAYMEELLPKFDLLQPDYVFCLDCTDEGLREQRLLVRGMSTNDKKYRSLVKDFRDRYESFSEMIFIDTANLTPDQVVSKIEQHIVGS